MKVPDDRTTIQQRIVAAVSADPRIVGCLDYGATSAGRGDAWSDLDVALFIRDGDLAAFEADWKTWAAQFGDLLLAYVGGVGHPWTVYDAQPLPLRVDFVFHPASTMDQIPTWPTDPVSPATMIWHDNSDGALAPLVAQIVGQSLAPHDPAAAFAQVGGDFWYYCLRTHTKQLRGELWAARHDFNFIIMGNLLALLRLECGAVDRWRGASAAAGIEQVVSAERLNQLNHTIPGPDPADLADALARAASLGYAVSANIAGQHGWPWPAALADRVLTVLDAAGMG